MTRSSPRRALTALLAMPLVTLGCRSVRLKEHRHPGPAVSVKVVWDRAGASRLVGGVHVRLESPGQPPLEGVTPADAPLLFDWLTPGRYRIVLTAEGMKPIERSFDLPPRHRVSVKVLVDAFERGTVEHVDGAGAAGDVTRAGLFVVKVVGAAVLVVSIVGLVVLACWLDDDDDDGEDFRHERWRAACEVCAPHGRDDPLCSCSCHW